MNEIDGNGKTTLDYAIENGFGDLILVLCKFGATLHHQTIEEGTTENGEEILESIEKGTRIKEKVIGENRKAIVSSLRNWPEHLSLFLMTFCNPLDMLKGVGLFDSNESDFL